MFNQPYLENQINQNVQKFSSPEEEIAFLREQIAIKENLLNQIPSTENREIVASAVLQEYSKKEAEEILHDAHPYYSEKETGINLPLTPEKDDEKMAELLGIMMERGVYKAMEVVRGLNNPHLDDDFHRFLVQYLAFGVDIENIKKSKEIYKDVNTSLFEIVLPEAESENSFKEVAALMEQFYMGMMAISETPNNDKDKNYFSLEIGLSSVSHEVVFYASVPRKYSDLFEKQILSVYPKARVIEQKGDYNIYNDQGSSLISIAKLAEYKGLPIKLFNEFEKDPISIILNAFAKLKKEGEGAALQLIVAPAGSTHLKNFGEVLDQMKKGKSLKEIRDGETIGFKDFADGLSSMFGSPKKEEKKEETSTKDEDAERLIGEKINSLIMDVNIRLVVSSDTTLRSEMILSELESTFNQFAESRGNSFIFERSKGGEINENLHKYTYRTFDKEKSMPLNLKELTTVYHFPIGIKDFAQLRQSENNQAAAPLDLPKNGTLLGINKYRHLEQEVFLEKEARVRHLYVIGQTGTGKTTILKNMIVQDIKNGDGCCFIDPHGYDVQDILASIPPERMDDVIYFDPGNLDRAMGLNMLEFDPMFPEQKSNVVDELLGIFNKLFDMKTAGGPAFEQYFRNAAFTVMSHPESGNTLLEIGRVMADKKFRDMKLSHCTNPLLIQFWKNAESTTGESGLSNYVPYITNKFDVFLSNDYMRPIVTQEKSSFNFSDIMNNKKIFLANLSKGKLGDINSSLLGLIIVGKITMAALSRPANISPDFYLYIDHLSQLFFQKLVSIDCR